MNIRDLISLAFEKMYSNSLVPDELGESWIEYLDSYSIISTTFDINGKEIDEDERTAIEIEVPNSQVFDGYVEAKRESFGVTLNTYLQSPTWKTIRQKETYTYIKED